MAASFVGRVRSEALGCRIAIIAISHLVCCRNMVLLSTERSFLKQEQPGALRYSANTSARPYRQLEETGTGAASEDFVALAEFKSSAESKKTHNFFSRTFNSHSFIQSIIPCSKYIHLLLYSQFYSTACASAAFKYCQKGHPNRSTHTSSSLGV
jgi:hypothetical protein